MAPPAKRVRFGSEEILEFPAPGTPAEREDGAEANDHLSDYEPSEDEEEDDLMSPRRAARTTSISRGTTRGQAARRAVGMRLCPLCADAHDGV